MIYDLDVIRLVKQVKTEEYISEHVHEYLYHYIFVLSGQGVVTVDDEVYETSERMLFAVSPGQRHSIYGLRDLCAIDIKFKAEGYLKSLCDFGTNCFEKLDNYEMTLITDMLDEAILDMDNSKNIINAKMLELLMQLKRRSAMPSFESYSMEPLGNSSSQAINEQMDKVRVALNYIENNLDKPLSVTKLAEISGYSCTHFSQIFKSAVGMSPKRYVNNKKIKYAKTLLLSSRMNITQISELLGYESIHYFSRIFKHITGSSPSSYYDSVNSDMGINLLEGYVQLSDDGFEFQKKKMDKSTHLPEQSGGTI